VITYSTIVISQYTLHKWGRDLNCLFIILIYKLVDTD